MKTLQTSLPALAAGIFTLSLLLQSSAKAQQQYSATDSWTVGPGDYILDSGVPACGEHVDDLIADAAQAIAAYRMGGIYGSLSSVLTTAARDFQPQVGGTAGQILDQIFGGNRYANCVPVTVVIPAGARVTAIQLTAGDGTGTRSCVAGQDCQIGWSRFDPPQFLDAGDSKVVTSVFRNWSGDRTRTATMTVLFLLN